MQRNNQTEYKKNRMSICQAKNIFTQHFDKSIHKIRPSSPFFINRQQGNEAELEK